MRPVSISFRLGSVAAFAVIYFLAIEAQAEQAKDLTMTLPEAGQLVKGKPAGDGWISLFADGLAAWEHEAEYWSLKDGMLHGESQGGLHHHSWTKKKYADFELHAVFRMTGKGANSGVCIRLQPENYDVCPGYQVDMGEGYWGCLWEEKRSGMVQKFPKELADKLVKTDDWNHYYVVAKGHRIQAWLNGVQTIDVVHKEGFLEGSIGFQLVHGKKHTVLDVKMLQIREAASSK
ncbi:MAG: DUF1080 domain-containing protein [Planctomycetota bacterium]|nr:DUF1080 domain-containing protein [Planctomycetota bacterium]MDA1247802.1 DUF1080 domain-containing protein [Planctomycetota bacterium]